jgi:hypothetical protein
VNSRKVSILVTIAASFGLGVAALVFALPGPIGCALVGFSGLDVLSDGTLVERASSEAERRTVLELQRQARRRIEDFFGAPRARPVVVFLRDTKVFWPLRFNDYASSQFLGSRACVVVGPNGTNVDVVAHELMHAELFERVGYWRRFTQIPMWFDEGVAMQVDLRPRYGVMEQSWGGTGFVRELTSYRQFFRGGEEQMRRHYAAAKAEVTQWLATIGPHDLFHRFERIREGESFDAVVGR